MPDRLTNCAICGARMSSEATIPDHSNPYVNEYDCPKCGRYTLDRALTLGRTSDDREKIILSGIVRHGVDASEYGIFGELIARDNVDRIMLSSGAPGSVDEQIAILLRCIGERASYYGEMTKYERADVWAARAFLPDWGKLKVLIDDVVGSEKPLWRYKYNAGSSSGLELGLTLDGWRELGELKKQRGVGDQCFVAMWFHDRMFEIFDNHISKALKAEGFKPYLVSRDPHDERIDNRILAQIRKSRFMIADFTGLRGGVYYEAGFAEGLGIPVMWSCNKSWETIVPKCAEPELSTWPNKVEDYAMKEKWWKMVHFDVRQLPFCLWSDGKDLEQQIVDWIGARKHLLETKTL
jgi:hypothetical protein